MKAEEYQGEYFHDWDEASASWCVFHTDKKTGFAFASFAAEVSAEKKAAQLNGVNYHE